MTNLMTEFKFSITSQDIDMVYSGFVLGVVIFILFLVTALEKLKDLKQIRKFTGKTKNIYQNKNSLWTIRGLEISVLFFFVVSIAFFIAFLAMKPKAEEDETKWVLMLVFYISFLIDVILEIVYLAISNYWSSSIMIVVEEDNLITTSDIINKKTIKHIRTDKNRHFYRITYIDAHIKGNLKLVKIRYDYKLKDFLSANGFLEKEKEND